MAGLLDVFSTGDPYGSMLSPEQQKALQNQSLLAAGLQMLMASGGQPGMPQPGLGQVIGQGFAAGANTYGNNAKTIYDVQTMAQLRQLEQMKTMFELQKMQRDLAQQERIASILNGDMPAEGVAAPAAAAPAVPPEMAPYLYSAGPAADGGIAGTPAQVAVSPDAIPSPGDQAMMSREGVVTAPVPSPDQAVEPLPEVKAPEAAPPAPKMTAKQAKAQKYRQVADAIAAADPVKAEKYYNMADKLDPLPEYGQPQEAMINGQRVLVQYDKQGNPKVVQGVNPAVSLPSEVGAVEYITGAPLAGSGEAGMKQVGKYNEAKAVKVNVGKDESFAREQDLRKEFTALPIYKAYTEVQQSWDQISTALKNPSPANDLVAATKFMKLLDPGSVVRESELGMAMAATGLVDRMQNYYSLMLKGEKLTPKQRQDFFKSAEALYKVANQRYSTAADQYRGLASGYNLRPGNVVPGAPAATAAPTTPTPVRVYDPKTGKYGVQ